MSDTRIRKAVIPAAGWGTRFFPMTKAQPKEMLPVVDKPVIQYVVEEAVRSGCDDILIITGKNKRAIEDHFDSSPELKAHLQKSGEKELLAECEALENLADIHYIRQKEQKGLGDAVLCAERHCGDEPFTVLLGDTFCIPHKNKMDCPAQMIMAYEKYHKPIIAVEPVPYHKIKDYGIIGGPQISGNIYEIEEMVEKPNPENAPSNLGAIGRYLLEPEIYDRLREITPGKKGELQLTDALQLLDRPYGLVAECKRYDIGDKLGWVMANMELLKASSVYKSAFDAKD